MSGYKPGESKAVDLFGKRWCDLTDEQKKQVRLLAWKSQDHGHATAQACPKLLTDGGFVYDVQILDGDSIIEINALSEKHAIEAASDIRVAIEKAVGERA